MLKKFCEGKLLIQAEICKQKNGCKPVSVLLERIKMEKRKFKRRGGCLEFLLLYVGIAMFGCKLPENKKTTRKHLEILTHYYSSNEMYFLEIPSDWDTVYDVGSITFTNPGFKELNGSEISPGMFISKSIHFSGDSLTFEVNNYISGKRNVCQVDPDYPPEPKYEMLSVMFHYFGQNVYINDSNKTKYCPDLKWHNYIMCSGDKQYENLQTVDGVVSVLNEWGIKSTKALQ